MHTTDFYKTYIGKYVLSKSSGRIGRIIGASYTWQHITVRFEGLAKPKNYSLGTIEQSLILLTTESRADYYLKLENAGISTSWREY